MTAFAFILCIQLAVGQELNDRASLVMNDNEIRQQADGQGADFFCNPLILNGKSLDYGSFSINSQGQLAVVSGDPNAANPVNVPFYISIRRNGYLVQHGQMDFLNRKLYSVDLEEVLSFSRPGDQLLIIPAKQSDWKAKRILNIIG